MIETTRFPLLRRFWHNKPIRWSLLGILLPVSGAMTAYAVTEPVPEYQGFKVERVSEELPAVYVEAGNFQSSYWAQEVVQQGDSLADVLTRMKSLSATLSLWKKSKANGRLLLQKWI